MKKVITLLLCLCMLLALAACGTGSGANSTDGARATTTEPTNEGQFMVGYSKVNITPSYSVPLRGYGQTEKRMSTGFLDYLYATCAAITDAEGNTLIVYGIDLTNAFSNCFPDFRQAVADATGVPVAYIHMSCSHMHSGCDMTNTKVPSVSTYIADMEKWLVQAAEEAMADRKPATIQIATAYPENLNFVRRYYREDGTPAGDNYGIFSSSPIKEHESEVDNQLQLIKFLREEGSDVIMANFQTHPHRGGGSKNYNMTADLVGAFRIKLEEQLGVNVLYFTGASGNVNPTSRIKEENITADFKEQGQALAQYAIDAEGTYTDVPTGTIRAVTQTYTGEYDHSEDHKLTVAKELNEAYSNGATTDEYKDLMQENGINSFFHAGAIISKASAGSTKDMDVYAFAIGDLGFAVVPYEMFDTNGKFVKDNSPFTMTFVLTCANTSNSYIPSALGYQNGGYERDQSSFVAGTGEILADLYVEMLNGLKGE